MASNNSHVAAADAGIGLLIKSATDPRKSADGTEWAAVTKKDDQHLEIYNCSVPGSSFLRFKATCVLPHTPKAVSEFLQDTQNRLTWDANVSRLDTTLIEEGPKGKVLILHSQTKAVGPISARDFVDVVAIRELADGCFVNGGASVLDGRFPEQKGVVRGWNSAGGGWHFAPTPGQDGSVHCTVTYVIHSDLKGYLPAFVINSALTGNFVTFFTGLRKAMAAAAAT